MLISLSKKVPNKPQHVVLVCEPDDMKIAAPVISQILGYVRPERRFVASTGKWKYLFHRRYLDDLLLALPQATKSKGLQRRLDRLNERDLAARAVEPFKIPNLWDRKNDCAVKPFEHQYIAIAECIRYLSGEMDHENGVEFFEHFLENDEMGLGKTFIVLCTLLMLQAIQKRELKVLVIAPKNGKFVWRAENARWSDFELVLVDADHHRPAERSALIKQRANITVINPEMLRGQERYNKVTGEFDLWDAKYPELFDFTYDIVVMDEYHRFGSPTSQQSRGMLQLKAHRFLPLSGTPYLNNPVQLWPVLHRCWPDEYPNYETFKDAIEIKDTDGSGKVVGFNPKVTRAVKLWMEPRSIRRRKDQVLSGLPPATPVDLPVELNREQRRLYERIVNESIIELEEGGTSIVKLQTIALRLKQACFSPELFGGSRHSAKVDELLAYTESMVSSGHKALIFSEWAKATRILQRDLAHFNPAYVDGSVSGEKRVLQAAMFNEDPECHIYIGTIGANQESISLGAATTVIFTDLEPRPLVNAQAAARSAAGGLRGLNSNVEHVDIVTMWGVQTYEEQVMQDQAFKMAFFNAIIEKDGGKHVEQRKIKSLRELLLDSLKK